MDIQKNIGQLDRTKFGPAHNNTVYCQAMFDALGPDDIKPETFGYGLCWAMLDPGMILEAHHHPNPEIYVFTSGEGTMRIDDTEFEVKDGTAVNIPPDAVHQVSNPESAIHPLIWVSIGLVV